jgi:hypothetical protein
VLQCGSTFWNQLRAASGHQPNKKEEENDFHRTTAPPLIQHLKKKNKI